MRQDILRQLAAFRLEVQFQDAGGGEYRRRNPNPMQHWKVTISSRLSDTVVEDWHQSTRMERDAIQRGALDLTEVYFKTFMGRMERLRKLGERRNFANWCKQLGFKPETLLSSRDTSGWRHKYEKDCRILADFTQMIGGDEKVGLFLSTTIR